MISGTPETRLKTHGHAQRRYFLARSTKSHSLEEIRRISRNSWKSVKAAAVLVVCSVMLLFLNASEMFIPNPWFGWLFIMFPLIYILFSVLAALAYRRHKTLDGGMPLTIRSERIFLVLIPKEMLKDG